MTGSPREHMERLIGSVKTLAADTRELIAQTAGHPGERLSHARERVRQTLSAVESRVEPLQHAVAERARYAAQLSAEHFRQHRWSTLAALAAIALAVAAVCAWQSESARQDEERDVPR